MPVKYVSYDAYFDSIFRRYFSLDVSKAFENINFIRRALTQHVYCDHELKYIYEKLMCNINPVNISLLLIMVNSWECQ